MEHKPSSWKAYLIGFSIILLVIIFSYTPSYQWIENKFLDFRFQFREPIPLSNQITHIDIDDKSLEVIGRWPWSRNKHAELLDVLYDLGAKMVAFDVEFFEQSDRALPNPKEIQGAVETSLLNNLPDKNYSPQEYNEYVLQLQNKIAEEIADRADVDKQFSGAIKFCKNIYLASNFIKDKPKQPETFEGIPFHIPYLTERHRIIPQENHIQLPVLNYAKGIGFVNIDPDSDGILRHVKLVRLYNGKIYSQLAFRVACDTLGIRPEMIDIIPGKHIELKRQNQPPIIIPIDEQGQVVINWMGNRDVAWNNIFEHIPYTYLTEYFRKTGLKSEENLGLKEEYEEIKRKLIPKIKDKICIIGMVAGGSTDLKPTPNAPMVPGVMMHSGIMNMILTNNFIHKASGLINILIIVLIGVLVTLIAGHLKPFVSAVLTVLVLVIVTFIGFKLFSGSGLWFDLTGPLTVGFFGFTSIKVYRAISEEQAKRHIQGVFGRYLAPEVVSDLIKNPDKVRLGGEKRVMTVFFSDIANFTNKSSTLGPDLVMEWINKYLTAMTDIIQENGGMIDKYEGDAIMALFGAPLITPDHAKRCCWAALDQRKALPELNKRFEKENLPLVDIRIGINTGQMIVGNLGSSRVLSYTVMGDEVNLASRLEGVNKFYHTGIMISGETYKQAKDFIEARELDTIRAKGMQRPVNIYELIAKKGEAVEQELDLTATYEKALKAYRERNWNEAIEALKICRKIKPADGPTTLLLGQCLKYQQLPKDEVPELINTLTSK
ncbi:MAG: adenylate/guanylate cyclase domain-containing protein [Planctomycetes bacterium]|nr:adenylate/guanylate cyclase domain-containing protein [Planctomycetota bacterium]